MMPFRTVVVSALAVGAALSAGVPAASASTLPSFAMPQFTVPTTAFAFPAGGFSSPVSAVGAGLGGAASNGGDLCGSSSAQQGGNGPTAGTTAQVCQGGGLSFVGPAIGQISSIVGPTVIGPAVGVTVIQSAGNVGGGG
jgi:hypothetical protein